MHRACGACCVGALVVGATGCSSPQDGTDVGNGATVSLDLRAYEAQPTQKGQSIGLSDGTRIDELWMVVERIRLRPGTSCSGGDGEIDVQGPLVADLLAQGVLGGCPTFPIHPGPFCDLRVGFHKADTGSPPKGAPAELADRSILVRGARSDGTPFVVLSQLDEEFELDARNGSFRLPAGATTLFLAYEVNPWIIALQLGSLTGSPIEISESSNQDQLQQFEDAVSLSARLFKDEDGDGQLSTSEHASGSELADGLHESVQRNSEGRRQRAQCRHDGVR